MDKKEITEISFSIISKVGVARSDLFTIVKDFSSKKITREKFWLLMNDISIKLNSVGKEHLKLIQKEAKGEDIKFSILLLHAEDLYTSTQTIWELVNSLFRK